MTLKKLPSLLTSINNDAEYFNWIDDDKLINIVLFTPNSCIKHTEQNIYINPESLTPEAASKIKYAFC